MSYKKYVGINAIALIAVSLATGLYMYVNDGRSSVPANDPGIASYFVAPLMLSVPALALCAAQLLTKKGVAESSKALLGVFSLGTYVILAMMIGLADGCKNGC